MTKRCLHPQARRELKEGGYWGVQEKCLDCQAIRGRRLQRVPNPSPSGPDVRAIWGPWGSAGERVKQALRPQAALRQRAGRWLYELGERISQRGAS
mgnify:CR=1 FL=1